MARPGKRLIKRRKKLATSLAPLRPDALSPSSSGRLSFLHFLRSWASLVFGVGAGYCLIKNNTQWAVILGLLAVVFQAIKVRGEQNPPWMAIILKTLVPLRSSLLLCLWIAFCLVTLTFPNFNWLFPQIAQHIPFQQSVWASIMILAGMAGAAYLLPDKDPQEDFSPWTARFWLLACLGVGAYLCLYHAAAPMGAYSIDSAFNIAHVRHVFDLRNYSGSFIYSQGLLPVWPFTAILLAHLLPDTSSLLIQRLTNTVLDLGAIWILYLAGKEIAGRRMGVLTAALAAVSKPLLTKIVSGYGSSAMTLGMALALLFTLRLMRKNDIPYFLKWGAAVAFLAYTDPPFQPFIPFFIFAVFAWFFYRGRKDGNPGRLGPLVWITFSVLLVYFLYFNNAFSNNNWITLITDFSGSWMPSMVLGVVLVCAIFYFPKMFLENKKTPWAGWVSGAWLGAVLSFPILTNAELLSRVKSYALATGSGFLSGPYLLASLKRVGITFQSLFWIGGDRGDMSLPGDAFFSYPEVILIALGLAFCIAKPNGKKVLIILAAMIGIAPHFVTTEAHSGRLIGCPPPFILLGALGLEGLIKAVLHANKSRMFYAMICVLLLGFWFWTAQGVFARVHEQWAEKPLGHIVVRNAAFQDLANGSRVYLAPDLADGGLGILYEGHSVHLLHNINVVSTGPGEKNADVVIFTGVGSIDLKKKLTNAFPKIQWSELHNSDQDPARSTTSYRGQIPFSELSNPRQTFFKVQRVADPCWWRTFTNTDCGLKFGFMNWEDKTTNVNDPVPPEVNLHYEGARFQGVIHVGHGAKYEINCKADNRSVVKIDGKKVFDLFFFRTGNFMAPGMDQTKHLVLEAGDHLVEVTTCFQRSHAAPEVTLRPEGSPGPGQSLWSSFRF